MPNSDWMDTPRIARPSLRICNSGRQSSRNSATRIRSVRQSADANFTARSALAAFDKFAELLDRHQWLEYYRERLVLPRLASSRPRGKVDDFLVICPQPTGPTVSIESVAGVDQLAVVQRSGDRRSDVMGEPTDPEHRGPAMRIVSNRGRPAARCLLRHAPRRRARLRDQGHNERCGSQPGSWDPSFPPPQRDRVDRPFVRFRAKQPSRQAVVESRTETDDVATDSISWDRSSSSRSRASPPEPAGNALWHHRQSIAAAGLSSGSESWKSVLLGLYGIGWAAVKTALSTYKESITDRRWCGRRPSGRSWAPRLRQEPLLAGHRPIVFELCRRLGY